MPLRTVIEDKGEYLRVDTLGGQVCYYRKRFIMEEISEGVWQATYELEPIAPTPPY